MPDDQQTSQDQQNIHQLNHGGYSISDMAYGFRPFDNRFGVVTSYIVTKPQFVCVFAFAVSGMQMMAQGGVTDSQDQIAQKAVNIIKSRIDSNEVQNRKEYTYELMGDDLEEDPSADWWIRSSS